MMQISAQIVKWIRLIAAHAIVAIRSARFSERLDIGHLLGSERGAGHHESGEQHERGDHDEHREEDPRPGLRERASRRWRR